MEKLTEKQVQEWVFKAMDAYMTLHTKKQSHNSRLTIKEAVIYMAELGYQTTKSKIYKLTSSGELPAVHINGKLSFLRKDIEEWVRLNIPEESAIDMVVRSAAKKLADPKIV